MAEADVLAAIEANRLLLVSLSGTVVEGTPQNMIATADTVIDGVNVQTDGATLGGVASTFASTYTDDGVYFSFAPDGGAIATIDGIPGLGSFAYLTIPCGNKRATQVTVNGGMKGNGRWTNIYAYNYQTSAWDLLTDALTRIKGAVTPVDANYTRALLSAHQKNLDPADGEVKIGFGTPSVTTADRIKIDEILVQASAAGATANEIAQAVWDQNKDSLYAGHIHVDTVSGVAGTIDGYSGLPYRPVTTFADAKTLSTDTGIKSLWVKPGSDLELTSSAASMSFNGFGYKLQLGGQDMSYATINGCEFITGTATSPTWEMFIRECQLDTCTLGEVDIHDSHITDVLTLGAVTSYLIEGCTGVPIGTPGIDFDSKASIAVVGRMSGQMTIWNMKAGSTLILDGNCDLTIDASCTAGDIYLSGAIALTNNGTSTMHVDGQLSRSGIVSEVWSEKLNSLYGGSIHIDTVNGVAGTTAGYNGLPYRPVASWADAKTLATSTGIKYIYVEPGSNLTLTSSAASLSIDGMGYKLALGGQDLSFTTIRGCEQLTGTSVSTTFSCFIKDCQIGACTFGEADFINCHLKGRLKAGSASAWLLQNCTASADSSVIIDFNSKAHFVTATNMTGSMFVYNMVDASWMFLSGDVETGLEVNDTSGAIYAQGSVTFTGATGGTEIFKSATVIDRVDTLHDFDPAADTVARVTLVDTVTELTEAVPGITPAQVKSEVEDALDEYDPPTRAELTSDKETITTAISNLNDFNPSSDTVARVTLVDTTTTASNMVAAAPDTTQIQAACASAVAAYDPPTRAELSADVLDIMDRLGSVDVDDFESIITLILSVKSTVEAVEYPSVTLVTPVAASGEITIYQSDDYTVGSGRPIVVAVADSDHSMRLDDPASIVLMKTLETVWTGASTSTVAGYNCTFAPTGNQTDDLVSLAQPYEIEAQLPDSSIITLTRGTMILVPDIPMVP